MADLCSLGFSSSAFSELLFLVKWLCLSLPLSQMLQCILREGAQFWVTELLAAGGLGSKC